MSCYVGQAMKPQTLFIVMLLAGCTSHPALTSQSSKPLRQTELAELEKCLPQGLTLETRFFSDGQPHSGPGSVREALEWYRPVIKDGKLCSPMSGKELYFLVLPPSGGAYRERSQQEIEERQRLEQKYEVITIASLVQAP
jgi:hypothetical protein